MAFTRNSAPNKEDNNTARNKVGGYLNINIHTKDGVKRLGSSGIPLRETHPLESAILALVREHPEKLQELTGRIELTFGAAYQEGDKIDLGLL